MKKAYLLAYSQSLGSRDEVKEILNSISEVNTWRYDMPYSFYLISEADASTLSKRIKERAPANARYIVVELAGNRQGWLTTESWFLIKNKVHKPKT